MILDVPSDVSDETAHTTLTKTCELCHGSGEVEEVREARLDDLSDRQIKTLIHSDVFKETGGKDQSEIEQMTRQNHTTGSTPNVPVNPSPRNL